MIKTGAITSAVALALGTIALIWVFADKEPQPITLSFWAQAEGEPMEVAVPRYNNPGGDGVFSISDFRFFISNIRLEGGGEIYTVPRSYHLARFDNKEAVYRLTLDAVPLDAVEVVHLSIGVDETANTSIETVGDLDPNSRMAWNWEVGYKFVLLEGVLKTDQSQVPLVYHVGFSENRKDRTFALPLAQETGTDAEISFAVDVIALFNGSTPIDLREKPSVLFDKRDAAIVADNYAKLLALQ